MTELARHANKGDFAAARRLQRQWLSLMQINFVEANPIPVKWGMHIMGLLEAAYRLPMVEPTAASKKKIEEVLVSSGLLATAGAH
jgi:4-hydroxy-tetrahydrodipicolinate synthase